MFGGASTPVVEEGGEASGPERQKDIERVREEAEEESDHDRATEEKMEEGRVVDNDVVKSRQINRDSQDGREAGLCGPREADRKSVV